jgi:RNA polymerase sigma-70 factor (ECF subfamily)
MCDQADTRFAELLAQQSPKMSKYARRLAGGEADADDLLQDTLMRCWSARHTFEDGTSLAAWVNTVMRNGYISGARRTWRIVAIDSEILNHLLSVPPT